MKLPLKVDKYQRFMISLVFLKCPVIPAVRFGRMITEKVYNIWWQCPVPYLPHMTLHSVL